MYDIIGDIHGCFDEFLQLLAKLGYIEQDGYYLHPQNRRLVFVGDITDRGPKSILALKFVLKHCLNEKALYVPGNHCDKLYRYFLGRNVQAKHGLETTVEELKHISKEEFEFLKEGFIKLIEKSPYYLVLDQGKLVVSHAGIRGDYIGKQNKQVRTFCLFGDITGETDERGFPVRRDWAQHYKGEALIVYGHSPVEQPRFVNQTVNIDTGCVFGGALTALRYPEITIEQVPSQQEHNAEKFWVYK